ncbi:MAG TPA: cation diffusion facilitator family transporter [Burkholderiaceae bacterium]|nr:cation diffusion facilitator family transporter [Burkholderiaceae bacterium]
MTNESSSGPDRAHGAHRVIYAAVVANLAIAVSKFVAAAATGSASMLAEGVHSAVDTGNEMLLLLGMRRSRRPPDRWHPFGYGKVLYFWALIVAVSVFSLGGGVSIYHGVISLLDPPELESPGWNYAVLIVAGLFEGYSWNVSRRELNKIRKSGESLWATIRRSKDPTVFTVLIEDTAALIGIAVALFGIWLGHLLNNPWIDPAASVVIGLVLVTAAMVLARETGGLLVGESIDRDQVALLNRILAAEPCIDRVDRLLTMQLGPDHILLAVTVRFTRGIRIEDIESAAENMERKIQQEFPTIRHVFFELA